MSKKVPDIVLFLGAGFSRAAGLPVMSEFGTESKQDFYKLQEHADADTNSSKYREAAPMWVQAAKTYYAFKNQCVISPICSKEEANNLETVFCVAEVLDNAGIENITLDGENIAVDFVLENIKLWLWKIYQQCPLLNPARETNEETYDHFFRDLRKLAKRLIVLTTNYDLIFEYLSWKHGIPCVYPYNGFTELSLGGTEKYIHDYNDNAGIVLCKLHGSVNYFDCPQPMDNEKIYITRTIGDSAKIGNSGRFKGNPALFAVDAIIEIRKQLGHKFVPALIPPTYAKLARKNWLRAIWRRAFLAFENASKIIFVGYSMPDTDGFMRALINASFAKRQNQPDIFVIDKCDKVHQRYRKLFKELYKGPKPMTLETASKAGLLSLLEG